MKAPTLLVAALLFSTSLVPAGANAPGAVPPAGTRVYEASEVDRPATLMFMTKPEYPAELRAEKASGQVVIECVVDFDGNVLDPIVKSATRPEFELPARRAVTKWKFKPAQKGKEKVHSKTEVTVKFLPPK